tara:strand:+ start:13187 stop:13384 length:198 start_codon:yes stop_codon:yes gene_type:complete
MRFNINFVAKFNLNAISGVYIDGVNKNGAADKEGIRSGDVIIEIDDKKISANSELQKRISLYSRR